MDIARTKTRCVVYWHIVKQWIPNIGIHCDYPSEIDWESLSDEQLSRLTHIVNIAFEMGNITYGV
jgi:hypothetical protein